MPTLGTSTLVTRELGRTRRQVTTFGLGGQASIQWTPEGVDPIAIIEKAVNMGVTYIDTSNVYGPSQENFGIAFRKLGISNAADNFDPAARERLYIATKTHFRSARCPEGERFRTDFSEGMMDQFGVRNSVQDVKRSLSLMFGDGQGGYPEGAYLDCIQFHNINTMDEIDMIYEWLDNPSPDSPWMGSLAAMLDLREGTNRTGLNPKNEKLVRHIGITGHWNSPAHMYAIQRDEKRILDTLLVAINANDRDFLCHQHNAIPVAEAAGMGIIGMKVFADAAYFHKDSRFSGDSNDVWQGVGDTDLPSAPLIQYPLSIPGINTVIVGIGHIDDDPAKCQLTSNIEAAQLETPLSAEAMGEAEKLVSTPRLKEANAYFQLKPVGLTAPRNVGVERDTSARMLGRRAVRVTWDTAYASSHVIERYDILRDGEVVGSTAHSPQISMRRFVFDDVFEDFDTEGTFSYVVRTVDASGATEDSQAFSVAP